jgi:hypothetical protein
MSLSLNKAHSTAYSIKKKAARTRLVGWRRRRRRRGCIWLGAFADCYQSPAIKKLSIDTKSKHQVSTNTRHFPAGELCTKAWYVEVKLVTCWSEDCHLYIICAGSTCSTTSALVPGAPDRHWQTRRWWRTRNFLLIIDLQKTDCDGLSADSRRVRVARNFDESPRNQSRSQCR